MRGVLRVARDVGVALLYLVLAVGGVGLATEGGVWQIIVGVLGAAMFLFGAFTRVMMLLHWDRPQTIGPPSPLPDEKRTQGWFPDDLPDENLFTPAETTFLDGLRERARRLPSQAVWSESLRARGAVVVQVSVTEARGHPRLYRLELSHTPGALRGDRLHAFTATGTDDELAEQAVQWFEAVLRRPVERAEWWTAGQPYAVRYQFADTGQGLIEAYARKRAPWRLNRRLLAAGHARVDTSKIGVPDAIVAVRVDGRPLPSPPLPDFDWYDCGSDGQAGVGSGSAATSAR